VGAVRSFLNGFDENLPSVPHMPGRRVTMVTGERMGQVIAPLAERLGQATGCVVRTVPVRNEYFGATVTTAGLLAGMDMLDALEAGTRDAGDVVLIPAESLNDDMRFIDDVAFDDVVTALAPARVIAAHEIASALVMQ